MAVEVTPALQDTVMAAQAAGATVTIAVGATADTATITFPHPTMSAGEQTAKRSHIKHYCGITAS